MTLTAFLTARLDEAAATLPRGEALCNVIGHHAGSDPSCPQFIADRIAADRAIVSAHTSDDGTFCDTCHDYHRHDGVPWPCPTLRWLARPYAGHPDYLPEWALVEDRP